jgi:hypothetical protein
MKLTVQRPPVLFKSIFIFVVHPTPSLVSSRYLPFKLPHVVHALGVSESHSGCHGCHFFLVHCEVRVEEEEKVKRRRHNKKQQKWITTLL